MIIGLDHVQLAIPVGQEDVARGFYCDVLGLIEEAKPPHLAKRGGAWFRGGSLRLHLGVDPEFHPDTDTAKLTPDPGSSRTPRGQALNEGAEVGVGPVPVRG